MSLESGSAHHRRPAQEPLEHVADLGIFMRKGNGHPYGDTLPGSSRKRVGVVEDLSSTLWFANIGTLCAYDQLAST